MKTIQNLKNFENLEYYSLNNSIYFNMHKQDVHWRFNDWNYYFNFLKKRVFYNKKFSIPSLFDINKIIEKISILARTK